VNVFEAWSREAMLLPPSSVIAHYHCMIAYSSENKLIAGLFERKACETDAQIQAFHFHTVPSRMHVPGCWRGPIEICQMLLNTTVTDQIRSACKTNMFYEKANCY